MLSFESPIITPWHRIAFKWKFFLVCVSSFILFILKDLAPQCIALFICCVFYLVAGWRFFVAGLERIVFLWPMIAIIIAWHVITNTTYLGLVIVVRLVTIVALSNLMTMTSKLSELILFVRKAFSPLQSMGINTRPLEIAIALVVRFTPVLIFKGNLLTSSWRSRTVARPNWRLVFPLTLTAIDDAEHVADALKARGGIHTIDDHSAT